MTHRLHTSSVLQTPSYGLRVETSDGFLTFNLAPCDAGLYVERTRIRSGVDSLTQGMLFRSDEAFAQWCQADRLHMDHPLAFANLRRRGCELLTGRH